MATKKIDQKVDISSEGAIVGPLLGNIPYFIEIHRLEPDWLLYSNIAFNIFGNKFFRKEHRVYFFKNLDSSATLEFYGHSGSFATLNIISNNYYYTEFDLNEKTNINNFNLYMYEPLSTFFVLSAKAIVSKNNKWIYFKKVLSTPKALKISKFDFIDEAQSLLIPQTQYSVHEPIRLANNFYIVQVVQFCNTLFKFGIVEKANEIILEDTEKESYIHIIDTPSQVIQLKNLSGRHIKVALIQFTSEAQGSLDIVITVGKEIKNINKDNDVSVQFLNVQESTITINNPYQNIIIEFILNTKETYTLVSEEKTQRKEKYIYYTFTETTQRGLTFEFDKIMTGLRFNLGVANEHFILKLTNTYSILKADFLDLLLNPYNTNEPLNPDEFFYISFKIPETVESYELSMRDEIETNFIPIKERNTLIKNKFILYSSKDKAMTELIIILFQCVQQQYTMTLSVKIGKYSTGDFYSESSKRSLKYLFIQMTIYNLMLLFQ